MRKVLLLVLLFLNLSVLPSWSADNVIIDRMSASEAEDLDIQIPNDVPPGFHSVEIEVYDESGTLSTQEIVFCKNLTGEVHWDNKCPDVTELWAYEDLMKIKEREKLPAYSPAQNCKEDSWESQNYKTPFKECLWIGELTLYPVSEYKPNKYHGNDLECTLWYEPVNIWELR